MGIKYFKTLCAFYVPLAHHISRFPLRRQPVTFEGISKKKERLKM
jgi:hypothetical protein